MSNKLIALVTINATIALLVNVLILRIKREVKAHGYKTTWFYGHLIDLYLILKMFLRQGEYRYLVMVLSLCALVVCFLYMSASIVANF